MRRKHVLHMKWFKILGVVLILLGISFFVGSNYIRSQVEQGKTKVRKAQSAVDATNSAASVDPNLYLFSRAATGPVQKQINDGKRDIVFFQSLAKNLDIAGWAAVVVGIGVTIWAFYRGKRG